MGAVQTARDALFGNPPDPNMQPSREGLLAAFSELQQSVSTTALGTMIGVIKATRTLLNADLAYAANTIALVYADATDANNDLYIKVGASGSGSWTLTNAIHGIINGLAASQVAAQVDAQVDPLVAAAAASAAAALVSELAAAASAASIAGSAVTPNDRRLLDSINRLSIPGSETRIGYQGVPGSNTGFGANTVAYVATSPIAQTLDKLTTVVAQVNSGVVDLVIMSGTPGAPLYKSKVSLPAPTAVGEKTWTAADFGTINLAIGDMVWINAPSGSISQTQTVMSGWTFYYVGSPAAFSVGASPGAITTTANRQLLAWINVPSRDLSVDPAHMTPAVQTKLSVVDLATNAAGSLKIGYQGSLLDAGPTGVNFGGSGLFSYIGTAVAAKPLPSFEIYMKAYTATQPILVIATGDPRAPVYKSVTTLPASNSRGVRTYTPADFGTINLAVGDHVFFWTPDAGTVLSAANVIGNNLYYKLGVATPAMPGSASGLTTQADSQVVARFRYAGSTPYIADEYLSATAQAELALMPASAPNTYRIFVGVGQSNIVGLGDAGLSPAIPAGRAYQYYSGALTQVLGDTIGNATAGAGTIWPSFVNAFFAATREGVIIVPAALGGTALAGGGTNGLPNWAPAGTTPYSTLRADAITALNAAIAACNAAGILWSFGGFIWGQGEADADAIQAGSNVFASGGGTMTAAKHEAALTALVTYFQSQMTGICDPARMPFIIQKLGVSNPGSAGLNSAYAGVQGAQVNVSRAMPNVRMGYQGAPGFRARGLMRDTYHYFQQGYNECGAGDAIAAANACIGLA